MNRKILKLEVSFLLGLLGGVVGSFWVVGFGEGIGRVGGEGDLGEVSVIFIILKYYVVFLFCFF